MPDPALILERFKNHLNEIVAKEHLYPYMDTNAEDFDIDMLIDILVANYIDVHFFIDNVTWDGILAYLNEFPQVGRDGGRRLVVAPCSPLFEPILEKLAAHFPNVAFIDINRAGFRLGDKTIQLPDQVVPAPDDVCLIVTRNTEAAASYEKKFGKDNCVNLLHLFIQRYRQELAPKSQVLLDQINTAEKPILFASPRPLGTMASSVHQMNRDGYTTFWLGSEEIKHEKQSGFNTPKVEDIPFRDFAIGGLIDLLHIFSNMCQGKVLYHFETIYPPAWDFSRVAICYAATLAMIRTIKETRPPESTGRLVLHMYDAIKPGVKNYQAGEACGPLYKQVMTEADAVIFSSYTEDFGDFVQNALARPLKRAHCHRYQVLPSRRRPRLTDGYHVALISVLLEEYWEPSRLGLLPYLRNVIDQGIYIHYYVHEISPTKIVEFRESLPEHQRHLFQVHKPIHDLVELANELSQYHVGWSLYNMQIFSDMVSHVTDQFTRDAMDLFTPTTLPSVIWTCAAAGLPIVCNRSMRGVVDMLPQGLTIPLHLSELVSLRRILEETDWDAVDRIPLDDLDISRQIHLLYDFLDGLTEEAP
ncbi:hypothetical protein SCOR_18950 [Sulfidibacter corallicola]|uniref:Uncharacterized protein n=1 Tax=Sulfidibacter corallicola TaxID=2818388 RepID=A0A8A4TWG8_SULCO|nr:hypothetical protein [Sulfidibacter corallicola]QTD53474.1 hypothetical protein J3U87_13550 [Sulfidibacter corallicola]